MGFEPGPVPLYERWQERVPPKALLRLSATRAGIKAAGDLVTLILGQQAGYTRKSAAGLRAPFVTPGAQQRTFTGTGTSPDLGYTYGTIEFAEPGPQYFLRVWRVRHDQCELEVEWLRPR